MSNLQKVLILKASKKDKFSTWLLKIYFQVIVLLDHKLLAQKVLQDKEVQVALEEDLNKEVDHLIEEDLVALTTTEEDLDQVLTIEEEHVVDPCLF